MQRVQVRGTGTGAESDVCNFFANEYESRPLYRPRPPPFLPRCSIGNSSASSWGPMNATLPRTIRVGIEQKSVDTISPGQYGTLQYSMWDAFGQVVDTYPQADVSVDCVSVQLPSSETGGLAGTTACRQSTVRVYDSHGYYSGTGTVSVRIQGQPGTTVQLRLSVSFDSVGDALGVRKISAFLNTTIQSCRCGNRNSERNHDQYSVLRGASARLVSAHFCL